VKVVVTGGAGFIGANLVSRLVDGGQFDEVAVIDDLSTGFLHNLDGLDVTFHEGSILDRQLLKYVLEGAGAVVHLAARPSVPRSIAEPAATHEANATGTLRLLEAIKEAGSPHMIVASSSSVYGRNPTLPKHESLAVDPVSPYAVSKLACESYARAYAVCFGLPVITFRFFNVFGPLQSAEHDYAAAIPKFIEAATDGRPVPIYGDGGQSRDFTYVGSVCAVIVDALRRRVTSTSPVNLAFGSRQTLLEVVSCLEDILGRELRVDYGPQRVGDVRHSQGDGTLLQELFPGISPVELKQGLLETVAWFRSERAERPAPS
jgi:UDP-glucose 4-epimerase